MTAATSSDSTSRPDTDISDPVQVGKILRCEHTDPFSFLGLHDAPAGGGLVVRVFRPDAAEMSVRANGGEAKPMRKVDPAGFFEAQFADATERFAYKLEWTDHEGGGHGPLADPYSFGNLLGEQDVHFLSEGSHRRMHELFGAHQRTIGDVEGISFVVWAPNAQRVSVIGDFNHWDGRYLQMRKRIEVGVWEIFAPGVGFGAHYKFEIAGADGRLFNKTDPFAFFAQHGTATAGITFDLDKYQWSEGDGEWMEKRKTADHYHSAASVYEVHLGSWARVPEEGDRFLSYLEFADRLLDHVVKLGFTHIELMPVAEFPYDGSWGYQVCGFFAPTSRFGNPDEFRHFVDRCHQRGVGVIVDWVPGHFPKDAHGLAKFDGTALYEHADPRQGEHMDWGTLIFNYGRTEVRNFLLSNALFWLEEYHIDGLRVDAVASMLYLDYSREEGEWIPNVHGGRENLEAIGFLRDWNRIVYEEHPGVMTIAEESTAFSGVSAPVDQGGLGFGFKWNMGWMHDFLAYMAREPVHRQHHHGEATFSMIYAYHENFFLVLSHDEVVHGKKSLLGKMPGDRWQQLANLRLFYAWMFAHPGKKLLFQGAEIAAPDEWNHDASLPWHLLDYPEHSGIQRLVGDLNKIYREDAALHELDHEPGGFEWIEHSDAANSVFTFVRRSRDGRETLVLVNATPVPRDAHRVGVPGAGHYQEILNTDAECYGGSNIGNAGGIDSEPIPWQGKENSLQVKLPPLATMLLRRT
jgi:1,4-alpha-glucan branching enzyme